MVGITPESLKRALCDLTLVERAGNAFDVALPQIYANGDVVSVVVCPEPDGFLVHDGGGGSMALEGAGVVLSPRLQEYLRERVAAYQCQFEQSRVLQHCEDVHKVAATAAVVGCASRVVADHVLHADPVPLIDFRRQLVDSLHERFGSPRVRENEEIIAATGSRYQVSAVLLDAGLTRPLAYVEPVANHQAVTRKFRTFYDLAKTPLVADTKRIAVYDSERAGISSGDVALLRDVSMPISYSDSEAIWSSLQ